MGIKGKKYPDYRDKKGDRGLPEPINERIQRRLIMSEYYKKTRGQDTPFDRLEGILKRSAEA